MTQKVTETPDSGGTTITEVRDVAGWSGSDRINNLNQIQRNDITTVTISPSSSTTVTWNYTYDLNGNMTSKTDGVNTTTYGWDEDNRLVLVTLPDTSTVAYTYDVRGRMLTRTDSAGTTSFMWDGMDCTQETDPSNNVTRYFVLGGVLRSFDRTVSGVTSVYQVHSDALGSVRKVTDSSGAVVATFDYSAYGEQLASTSDSVSDGGLQYRFVGALGVRWDAGIGLYYMRARWYDPGLGRFLGRDPKRSGNRYAYSLCNPAARVDPTGQVSITTSTAAIINGTPIGAGTLNQVGQVLNLAGSQYGGIVSTLQAKAANGQILIVPDEIINQAGSNAAFTDPDTGNIFIAQSVYNAAQNGGASGLIELAAYLLHEQTHDLTDANLGFQNLTNPEDEYLSVQAELSLTSLVAIRAFNYNQTIDGFNLQQFQQGAQSAFGEVLDRFTSCDHHTMTIQI